MTRVLIGLLIAASLAALWYRAEARSSSAEVAQLREINDDLTHAIEQAREAWKVAQAHAERLARERAEALAVEDAITSEEGSSAPASDYLRRAVDSAGQLR